MQYQVPQFIEIEDKIFGPLTFRQFLYLAAAGGAFLIFFTLLPLFLAVVLSVPFAVLGFALAFYKVNDQPFLNFLEHAFFYYVSSRLYLWKQRDVKPIAENMLPLPKATPTLPKVSESKLKDLAWSLNIKDRQRLGVTDTKPTGFEI